MALVQTSCNIKSALDELRSSVEHKRLDAIVKIQDCVNSLENAIRSRELKQLVSHLSKCERQQLDVEVAASLLMNVVNAQ